MLGNPTALSACPPKDMFSGKDAASHEMTKPPAQKNMTWRGHSVESNQPGRLGIVQAGLGSYIAWTTVRASAHKLHYSF